jgi:hypothetical protein
MLGLFLYENAINATVVFTLLSTCGEIRDSLLKIYVNHQSGRERSVLEMIREWFQRGSPKSQDGVLGLHVINVFISIQKRPDKRSTLVTTVKYVIGEFRRWALCFMRLLILIVLLLFGFHFTIITFSHTIRFITK